MSSIQLNSFLIIIQRSVQLRIKEEIKEIITSSFTHPRAHTHSNSLQHSEMCNLYSASGSTVETKCCITLLITAGEKRKKLQTMSTVERGFSQHCLYVNVPKLGIGFGSISWKVTLFNCNKNYNNSTVIFHLWSLCVVNTKHRRGKCQFRCYSMICDYRAIRNKKAQLHCHNTSWIYYWNSESRMCHHTNMLSILTLSEILNTCVNSLIN